ncbi:MAG: type I restriction enzyme S subunit [Paracoccaceae bacterium]
MSASWKKFPLHSICEKVSVGHVGTTTPYYRDTGIAFLRTKNIGADGIIIDDLKYITPEFHTSLKKSQLKPGDLILTRVLTDTMKCGIVPQSIGKANCANVILIRPKQGLSSKFLHHLITSPIAQNYLLGKRVGAAQQVVNTNILKNWLVPLPPLEEQQRIVALLDEAFEGLARARAHAEANLQNARELFESYLHDLFTHPRADWERRELRHYCKKITVGHVGPMATRYKMKGTPFLRSQNIRPFKVDQSGMKFIDEAFTQELSKSELRPGDVAIVRTGYPGTCAVIPDDMEIANCADLVIARTNKNLDPHFLELLLNSSFGKRLVAGASVGAAQKHFNVSAAKKAVFPIPSIAIQQQLVEQAGQLRMATDELIAKGGGRLDDLDDLRQSLLQKAFTGELT